MSDELRGRVIHIRLSEREYAEIVSRAAGQKLSKYVRGLLLVMPTVELDPHTVAKIGLPAKPAAKPKRGPTCKHGTARGWNCWQCGGVAVVAAEPGAQ